MGRVIATESLIEPLAALLVDACCDVPAEQEAALRDAAAREESPYGKDALGAILENAAIARRERIPCCQDTGSAVVFMDIGQEVSWTGRPLRDAVNEAVRKGYTEGYLRKSMVADPLTRVNTGDNTPAMLHTEIVPGERVRITVLPKGGGSENMGAFTTLLPQSGEQAIIDFVVKSVERAGGKPCPPVVLGVGVGGTMDICAYMAKKALCRPAGSRHREARWAALEERLLDAVNGRGIGPLGMGGVVTALDVHIEYTGCHITALPVALNFQCHAARCRTLDL
jgi:fumarate hydratase subunit alpha